MISKTLNPEELEWGVKALETEEQRAFEEQVQLRIDARAHLGCMPTSPLITDNARLPLLL